MHESKVPAPTVVPPALPSRRVVPPLVAVAICLAGALAPRAAHAQAPGADALSGRRVSAPRLAQAPVIDGRLDDAVWREAAHITDLFQRRPFDGLPATEASDIFLAYDSDNLYIGFHAHYADPRMLRANRRDRDETFEDDLFLVYFGPVPRPAAGVRLHRERLRRAGRRHPQHARLRPRPRGGAARRHVVGRAVRHGRRARRRRVHRGDGHPLQELPLPAARRGRAAPVGAADRAHHRRQGRGRPLVAHLARRSPASCRRWACSRG